jgi:hypothetical protein
MDILEVIYIDPRTNVEFILPAFENINIDQLIIEVSDNVYRAMTVSLIRLSLEDWELIPCFQVNGIVFEIERDGHDEQLQNCLDYFESTEEYEICTELRAASLLLSK